MKKEEIATLVKYRVEQAQIALADARNRASRRHILLLKLCRNTYKVFSPGPDAAKKRGLIFPQKQ